MVILSKIKTKTVLIVVLTIKILIMKNLNTTTELGTKPVRKGKLPQADIDLADVVKKVSEKWTATPEIKLIWTTAAEFAAKATEYQSTLDSRLEKGAIRPGVTQAIRKLDRKMDDAVVYVKNYLLEKYKKESFKSHFASLGIEQRGRNFQLPRDQNKRAAALKIMIKGIATHGLGAKEFGTAFWTTLKTEYEAQLQLAFTTDSAVSKKVGEKNLHKEYIVKVLNALIFVLRGNYPDAYQEELRTWGFHKEKY